MANYSGLSQTSNISGISSVSRSTSIRGLLKVDNTSMESSGRMNVTGRAERGSTNVVKRNYSENEEVNKSFARCQEIISDYGIKKLLHECVKEASLNEDKVLKESTAKKLSELIAIHEVERYLHLPDSSSNNFHEKITLLGITDLPKIELAYEEKLDIKRSVENKLRMKTSSFLAKYQELGGNIEELMKRSETLGQQEISEVFGPDLLQWKEKIEQECLEYEKDISEYKEYFSEWVNLKYGDMNDIQLKKIESLLVKVQVSEVQAKITKLNCILKMFKDTPFTLEAYEILNSSLDKQIAEMDEEIKKKEAMKKLYQDLSGTEYDNIVQRYSALCKAIEKKKKFMALC